jgi:hypothetical protein
MEGLHDCISLPICPTLVQKYPHLRRWMLILSLVRRGSEPRSSFVSAGTLLLGATEHSENAAQGSVRVGVLSMTMTIVVLSCVDR